MKNKLPVWEKRSLFEKVFTCLVVVFAFLAIAFIILETAGINVNQKLDSLFLSLELLSLGVLYYKYNKIVSIVLLILESIIFILTLVNMFK